MVVTFIEFHKSLSAALSVRQSPIIDRSLTTYRGIRLLPDDEYPYTQVTQHPTGINLEDWTVKVYSVCGKLLGDITPYFFVDTPFIDDLGMPQIKWSIKDCPSDFGNALIYLEITQTVGETFWTTPFQLTAIESEKTTRFDYRDGNYGYFQSVRLVTWFEGVLSRDEISSYDEKASDDTVTKKTVRRRPELYFTDRWSVNLFEKFADMLTLRFVYCDLVRSFSFEPFEIPRRLVDTNWNFQEYQLSKKKSDVYDPNFSPSTPVPPDPGDTIVVNVRAYKKAGVNPVYRGRFGIETVEGYETLLFPFSSVVQNGYTAGFNEGFTTVTDGVIYSLADYVPEDLPNQLSISSFEIRVQDGSGNKLKYIYSGPDVTFTASEINNGIEKQFLATIQTV